MPGERLRRAGHPYREPVSATRPRIPGVLRTLAAAAAAGARHGCVLPIVENGRVVVALQEYYSRGELPFFGGRAEKWQAIGRVAAHARRAALTAAQLQETLHDREAVTTVVGRVGRRQDATPRCAPRSTPSGPRSAGPTAPTGRWTRRTNVLRFRSSRDRRARSSARVTLAATLRRGRRALRPRLAGPGPGVRPRPGRADRLRAGARPRSGPASGPACASRSWRGPGHRHDGLLHHRDHRPVRIPRVGAAQRAAAGLPAAGHRCAAAEADAVNARALLETVSRLREAAARRQPGRRGRRHPGLRDDRRGGRRWARPRPRSATSSRSSPASPTRPTCSRSTPPSRRPAPASSARVRGRRQRGQGPRPGDRRGHQAGVGPDRRHPGSSSTVAAGIHATSEIIGQMDAVQSRMARCSSSRCRWRRRSRPPASQLRTSGPVYTCRRARSCPRSEPIRPPSVSAPCGKDHSAALEVVHHMGASTWQTRRPSLSPSRQRTKQHATFSLASASTRRLRSNLSTSQSKKHMSLTGKRRCGRESAGLMVSSR